MREPSESDSGQKRRVQKEWRKKEGVKGGRERRKTRGGKEETVEPLSSSKNEGTTLLLNFFSDKDS
jgi:hypothetical protein